MKKKALEIQKPHTLDVCQNNFHQSLGPRKRLMIQKHVWMLPKKLEFLEQK